MSATPPPGYRTQSEDTSYEAELILFERWRSMDPAEKVALISELNAALRKSSLADLEQRFPDASPRELELRLVAQMYGKEIVRDLMGVDVPDGDVRFE